MKTHLDLFSGIGGFALAASWAGFKTIGFCEYEDYPSRVLSARFPGVPIHGDIRELNGEQYRGVSLITGGFPCQPFSLAGKQAGKADDRYLWPEMLRVIAQAQPDWVVAENVTGIVTLALDQVLSDLEGEGYACGTVIVPACAVDAQHRRDRVWIIAHAPCELPHGGWASTEQTRRDQSSDSGEVLANPKGTRTGVNNGRIWQGIKGIDRGEKAKAKNVGNPKGNGFQGCGFRDKRSKHSEEAGEGAAESIGAGTGSSSRNVANPNPNAIQGLESGSQSGGEQRPAGLHGGAGSTPSPDWWEVEPPVGRVANGIPKRVDRLRGLGNAIVPQVAYEILRLLIEK